MSAVINNAKQNYRKALIAETVLLVLAFCASVVWKTEVGIALLFGMCAGFLPHALFVYWVLFRKYAKNPLKMTAFYQGEALKWLLTIAFVSTVFLYYPALHKIAFFVGLFFAIVINNVSALVFVMRKP